MLLVRELKETKSGCFYMQCEATVVSLMGWAEFGPSMTQPVFKMWSQYMRTVLPDGCTSVTKQIPPTAFADSWVIPSRAEQSKKVQKACLFILGVKKVTD